MKQIALAIVALSLAACSSNTSGPSLPVTGQLPQAQKATASFTIKVPPKSSSMALRPAYVSPNTQSLSISVTSVNGSAPSPTIPTAVVGLTPSSSNCSSSSGTLTCTTSLLVPSGTVVFSLSTFASTNGTGSPLSSSTVTAAVTAGSMTAVPVTLNGVPASIAFSASTASAFKDGASHTLPLSVVVKDASGATIIGPGNYATPISLAISNDPNGALSLSAASITSPSQTISVSYNTAVSLSTGTITASSSGLASATINVVPLVSSPSQPSSPGLISGVTNPYNIALSEAGFSSALSPTGATSAISIVCTPANCTPASSGATVSYAISPSAHGTGTLSFADGYGATLSLPYKVSTQSSYSPNGSSTFQNVAGILGADGNLWYETYVGGSSPSCAQFSRVSTSGVLLNSYTMPANAAPACSFPAAAVVAGPDNAIWFADGYNDIGRVSTASGSLGAITEYALSIPGVTNADPTGITLGSDGNLWFSEQPGYIGRITTAGVVTQFPINAPSGQYAQSIANGSDGALWFTLVKPNGGQVGRITTSGSVSTYALPQYADPNGGVYTFTPISNIVPGSDGSLWFVAGAQSVGAAYQATDYCKITTGGAVTCNPAPVALFGEDAVTAAPGPDGAIWIISRSISNPQTNEDLIRLDTSFNAVVYDFPYTSSSAVALNALINDEAGHLWYSDEFHGTVNPITP